MLFRMLYDDKLAQAAYLIGCQRTGEAIVIDPERDVDRYIAAAQKENLKITAITETHIHADFLSGARELAEKTNATLYLSDEGDADWKYLWLNKKSGGGAYDHQLLKHNDIFMVGNIEFKVVHTPGHTPEHISFLVTDQGGGAEEPMGIASGDFVFVGDVGRPDLLETAAGVKDAKEKSAVSLFDSLQQFKTLPDYLQLWPGHGSGSACGKALGAVPQSTVGYEKRFNASIAHAANESDFVNAILAGQTAPPLYFSRMKRLNKEGPDILGKLPEPQNIAVAKLTDYIREGAAILDTRPWAAFAERHVKGSLFTPLNKSFPTISGSYVDENQKIVLIVEQSELKTAVTDLIRIGLDNIEAYIQPGELMQTDADEVNLARAKQRDITELVGSSLNDQAQVLDVRQEHEFEAGHLPNALNIPHTILKKQLAALPANKSLLVYCQTGARSSYAAGLLASRGFDVVQLNGGFASWASAGGEVVKTEN